MVWGLGELLRRLCFRRFYKAFVVRPLISPFAAAGDEWIDDDQQGELFEALAEFSLCRR